MTLKQENNKDPWILAEDMPNMDLFFSQIFLKMYVSTLKKNIGYSYKKTLAKYNGYHLWFYYGDKDSFEVGERIVDKLVNTDGLIDKINKKIVTEADKLINFANAIAQSNLHKLSNKELWNIYNEHYNIHSHCYTWGGIPVAADLYRSNLTSRIKKYLRDQGVEENHINDYFIILTQSDSKSLIFIEQEDLLKIADKISKDKKLLNFLKEENCADILNNLPADILELINKHWSKYYYTKHLWISGEYTITDYIEQIKEILCNNKSPQEILQNQYSELEQNCKKRKDLIEKLKIDEKWQNILNGVAEFMITKVYRRYAQLLAIHHMSSVIREIARRKYITEKQVRFMLKDEVQKMLLKDDYDEQILLKRTNNCIYYADENFEKIYIDNEASELLSQLDKQIGLNVNKLGGEVSCVGYAKGKVKIIIRAEDMKKMEQGDILVSVATDPDIVSAMKKAAAIVTDAGGVTSHAAIVSRELNIPCVIGTKIATKVLKDGDLVEVDANKGFVKKVLS